MGAPNGAPNNPYHRLPNASQKPTLRPSRPTACSPRDHRPETLSGNPDFLKAYDPRRHPPCGDALGDPDMSKSKSRGNREAKKPKKEKVKVSATSNSNLGKDGTVIAGKKIK